MANLIRIDRNGSKHWESNVYPKCNGTGHLPEYQHVEGGVCFKCNGSGKHYRTWIERTPEYEEVLRKRRVAKANAKFWEKVRQIGCDSKYGTIMVSEKMRAWHAPDIREFYGGGAID